MRDYPPVAQRTIKDSGGRTVAAGTAQPVEGDAPKARVVIQLCDSPEKIPARRASAEYNKAVPEIGDNLAKFRAYFVNGVSQ